MSKIYNTMYIVIIFYILKLKSKQYIKKIWSVAFGAFAPIAWWSLVLASVDVIMLFGSLLDFRTVFS
jgi:hypothetical protein